MRKKLPIIVTVVLGVVILASFVFIAKLFYVSQEQRHASCNATIIALRSVSQTSAAGIRPISPIPRNLPTGLFLAFKEQQLATIKENIERYKVIKQVNMEIIKLSNSDFCK